VNNVLFKNDTIDNNYGIILLHGRGADAADIMGIAESLKDNEFLYAAPNAPQNTWYPYSFLAPEEQNEPYLSNSLKTVDDIVNHFNSLGISDNNIMLSGFSQGACLALEYAYRTGRQFGGVAALSGGIISTGFNSNKKYILTNTSVFLGCSENDPHIPVERVQLASDFFSQMGAEVETRIYRGSFHGIIEDEILEMRRILAKIKEK
jgi:predicted esterase